MSDLDTTSEIPNFDWTDAQLMEYLAQAWDMLDPAHIRVLGQFRIAGAGSFGFLDNLHDPVTGVKLPSLAPVSQLHQGVFVPGQEFNSPNFRLETGDYAIAKLMLAPLERRQQRDDPLACTVSPDSVTPLSRVPKSWGVTHIEAEESPLLLDMARKAIQAQLKQDNAELSQQLENARHKYAQELAQNEAVLSETITQQHELMNAIQQTTTELETAHAKSEALEADFELRREVLENKLRDMEALLQLRGERLVALDLVDRDDLSELVSSQSQPESREGHDYQQVLGGDFAQLAPYVQARLWEQNMLFSQAQLRDFLALMRTNDLVILAGDSGSGKTSLVRAVAESIGGRCTIIPVKPNWTGPEDLLGYYNPIERSYQATPFLQALQAAAREPEVPHFICLDEMNLARVEHYFADFLSLLEVRDTGPTIALYTSDEERHVVVENSLFLALEKEVRQRVGMADDATFTDLLKNEEANALLHQLGGFKDAESVLRHHGRLRRSVAALLHTPTSIRFPSNVRIIGAINIDETTYYLSPKVLDRAHVLRFRNPVLMDWDAVESELEHFTVDVELPLCLTADDLGQRSNYPPYDRSDPHAALLTEWTRMHLDPLGIEFGLRAIRQSLGYIQAARQAGISDVEALNNVVQHKILPKLLLDTGQKGSNGNSKREILVELRDALETALQGLQPTAGTESSVVELDRLIDSLDGNNGIANYWLR